MEPFALLAFEAMAKSLIFSLRPDERSQRVERYRQRMRSLALFSEAEIEHQISLLPPIPTAAELQLTWDKLFMIDLWPEKVEQFGIEMAEIVEALSGSQDAVLFESR